ncbi:MAG: GbsR/MarR family transcriptional regulator [Clostridia bacterium]
MEGPTADELQAARGELIQALGRQSAFWGVGKITGQLFAVLYLADGPLSLEEVAQALSVSKANVSVSIRTLEQLGMVRRYFRPGDRRVFFDAETNFWLIAHRLLERRQRPAFAESFEMVEASLRLLDDAPDSRPVEFARQRVRALKAFYDELDQMAAWLVQLEPQRITGFVKLLGRVSRKAGRRRFSDPGPDAGGGRS